MRPVSVFVTGGTGFFGKSLLSMLRRGFLPDWRFTLLSRDPEGFLRRNPCFAALPNVGFLSGDIRDFRFPEERFDCILHAAAPSVDQPDDAELRDIILGGTARVLHFAELRRIPRLLYVSSGAVYGPQPPGLPAIPVDFPCAPVSAYGKAKLAAERLCFDSPVPTVVARCFAFTGPFLPRDRHFAIGNFIGDCLAGRTVTIRGDGTPLRSYLYADDLVEWLFAALRRGRPGGICHVGSDAAVSIRELAETVRAALNTENAIEVLQAPRPGVPPQRYIPDIARTAAELGVRVTVPLAEAIRRSAAGEPA